MPSTGAWQGSINRPDAIYIVKSGDSLSKIALLYYRDVAQYHRIATANKLDPAKPIAVGQRLVIPNGGSSDPPKPQTTTAADPSTHMGPPAPNAEALPVATVIPGFTALSLNDWRVWAGGGLLLLAVYMMMRKSRR